MECDAPCVASEAALGKCVPERPAESDRAPASKLLRSGCATRSVYDQRNCKDTVVKEDALNGTIVKARTDSVAMALLANKQRSQRALERPDRGFIR